MVTSPDGYGRGAIITPEAVLLDFEIAGLVSRSMAYTIDVIVQFLALLLFTIFLGSAAAGSEIVGLILLLVGLIVIILGYPVVMETFNQGRTLGRMIVRSRVVTVEGAPIRFRHAVVRALLGIVDLLASVGLIAVVTSLVTRRGQRLGDIVAGTMVIRDPKGAERGDAIRFWPPTYLVEWSRTIDCRQLDDATYQLAREVLTRPELTAQHRGRVMTDVADLVGARLSHAPRPPTLPPRDYLLAVMAAAQGPVAAAPPPPPVARPAVNLPPPPNVARPGPADLPPPTNIAPQNDTVDERPGDPRDGPPPGSGFALPG